MASYKYVWVLKAPDGSVKAYRKLKSLESDLPEKVKAKKLQKTLTRWVYGPGGKYVANKVKVQDSFY